ncbi:hypothetical protein AAER74_27390, partial [Klebsiella pneumoniae]
MMEYGLSLVVVAVRAGCGSTPNLAPGDGIVAMKPAEAGGGGGGGRGGCRVGRG